jgi:hypothetical protein
MSDCARTPEDLKSGIADNLVERYLNWLDSEIDNHKTYHHHKETMAWSATVAYLGVVFLTHTASPYLTGPLMRLGFTVAVLILARATGIFVMMQFDMRWVAADLITALSRCRCKLLPLTDAAFRENFDSHVPEVEEDCHSELPAWPVFVQKEIVTCATSRQPLSQALPMLLMPHTEAKVNARRRSELASCIVLVLVTAVAVLMIWFPRQ